MLLLLLNLSFFGRCLNYFVCNSKQQNHPPVSRTHPPYAGCVAWVRSLQHRLQETYDEFAKMEWIFYRPAKEISAATIASLHSFVSGDSGSPSNFNNNAEGEEEDGGVEGDKSGDEGGGGDEDDAEGGAASERERLSGGGGADEDDAEGEAASGRERLSGGGAAVTGSRTSRLSGASTPAVLMTPENFASARETAALRQEFRPIFLNMNLTIKKLITYEVGVHKMWVEKVEVIRGGLKCPILVRDPGNVSASCYCC